MPKMDSSQEINYQVIVRPMEGIHLQGPPSTTASHLPNTYSIKASVIVLIIVGHTSCRLRWSRNSVVRDWWWCRITRGGLSALMGSTGIGVSVVNSIIYIAKNKVWILPYASLNAQACDCAWRVCIHCLTFLLSIMYICDICAYLLCCCV
jgi:hypothetical protein